MYLTACYLSRRGHADAEIEAVFAKYDLDGDRVLNEEEQRKMHEDLEGQKVIDNSVTCIVVFATNLSSGTLTKIFIP